MEQHPIIQVTGLQKKFGAFEAVKDVNFTVNKGDVFGFLGPNGAGKSTTMRCMLSLIKPNAGQIHLFGKDLQTDQQFSDDPETVDAVLSRVQKTINKKLGIAEIQYASGSSPPVIKDLTVSRNADWHKLLRVEQTPQNLFDIVFDPEFNGENVFEPHINAVEKRIDRIKSLFTQSDYDKMKERLKQVRKEMDEYDA